MDIKIAPSILSADFGRLNEDIASIESYVDMIHVDVMDYHFVPNLTFGAPVFKWIKSDLPKDCHLMVDFPERYIEDFKKAGCDIFNFHVEAKSEFKADEIIQKIKDLGMKVGITLKPKTPVLEIENYLDKIDMVLIMSVEPGFGGQSFMPEVVPKIKEIREKYPDLDIQVDGGINEETAKIVKEAGANVLVAGSYIFGSENREQVLNKLKGKI